MSHPVVWCTDCDHCHPEGQHDRGNDIWDEVALLESAHIEAEAIMREMLEGIRTGLFDSRAERFRIRRMILRWLQEYQ